MRRLGVRSSGMNGFMGNFGGKERVHGVPEAVRKLRIDVWSATVMRIHELQTFAQTETERSVGFMRDEASMDK